MGGEDGHPVADDTSRVAAGEAEATPAGPSPAQDEGAASEAALVESPTEAPGPTADAGLDQSPPQLEAEATPEGASEGDPSPADGGTDTRAAAAQVPEDSTSADRSASSGETPRVSEQGGSAAEADRKPPVDNAVDETSESSVVERRIDSSEAGDNIVDEHARDRSARLGSDALPEARLHAEHSDRADRDALAAAIPTPGDDTPLARELAENARRRIQLTGRRFPKPESPRVLTVANQKGGVGKTTTTVNVAAALAQSGLKALVIDLDPQGNASTALGIDHHAEVPSIYDVLVDGTKLLDVIQPCTTVENLFCAPATIDLAGAEIELVSLVARESRLEKAIAAAGQQGHEFDYILIDCPPSLGLLTVNAMVAASEVFIPIQCEYYALEGLSQLLKNIDLVRVHLNPSLHVSTILLTMYDGRTRLSAQVADEVREHFPEQVLRTTVPRSVRVSEAPSFGETVMTYDPASSGALAYLEAAGEMADRGAAGRT
ncbi:AAA family ATPase [Terrabacter sp. MAHUQ-38]|nr:AAA family ATPase [Terrabacter sp. MAHUQ-38]